MALMFVNGQAMKGGSIHANLRNATFAGEVSTSAGYRFFSIRDEFPGLLPAAEGGAKIVGELYEIDEGALRTSLLPAEPPELELSAIELSDGRTVFSMVLRRDEVDSPGVREITSFGGWRAYRKSSLDDSAISS